MMMLARIKIIQDGLSYKGQSLKKGKTYWVENSYAIRVSGMGAANITKVREVSEDDVNVSSGNPERDEDSSKDE